MLGQKKCISLYCEISLANFRFHVGIRCIVFVLRLFGWRVTLSKCQSSLKLSEIMKYMFYSEPRRINFEGQ